VVTCRGDESGDWLDYGVPVGALDHAGLAYWDGRPRLRSEVMDAWLAAIGTETFKNASFILGVIGFEVSGCTDASTLAGKLPQTGWWRRRQQASRAMAGRFQVPGRSGLPVMPQIQMTHSGASRIARVVLATDGSAA
jgi:hypothetical protein